MKSLFLSKELSIKAKEYGFNEPCLSWYWEDLSDLYDTLIWGNHNKQNGCISAPLYDQLFEWLFREYEILIVKEPTRNAAYTYEVWEWHKEDIGYWEQHSYMTDMSLEEAINKAFTILREKNNKTI